MCDLDRTLGQLALDRRLVNATQLQSFTAQQRQAIAEGGTPPPLAQLLLGAGQVSASELVELLRQARPETADDLPDGLERLGKYRLVREVARGGAGVVYEAIDPDLRRQVAIKLLHLDLCGTQEIRRLQREATLAASLNHPNIIKVHEVQAVPVGHTEGQPHFIVMDYVEGETLESWLPRLSIQERVQLLEQVAQAVGFAHQRGVVHRDLKPANILIAQGQRAVVTDFGLAWSPQELTRLTRSGMIMGTPYYMAPEQILGEPADVRADVWALGVMLYEMLAGSRPFSATTHAELYELVLYEQPISPDEVHPGASAELAAISLKALSKEPAERYANAGELALELRRWIDGEPVLARPRSTLQRWVGQIRRRPWIVPVCLLTMMLLGLIVRKTALATRAQRLRVEARRADQRKAEQASTTRVLARAKGDAQLARKLEAIRGKIAITRPMLYVAKLDLGRKLTEVRALLLELERLPPQQRLADSRQVAVLLGMGWYFLGDSPRAEQALLRARRNGSRDGWVTFYLCRIYLERAFIALITPYQGRRVMQRWMARVMQQLDGPMGDWSGSREIDRHVMRVYRALAEDKLDQVRRLCRQGQKDFAGHLGAEQYWQLEGWLARGEARISAFDAALKIRPHYPLGYLGRGCARSERGDPAGAVRDFTRALRLCQWAETYVCRGNAYEELGQLQRGIDDYTHAIRLRPRYVLAYFNRGNARTKKGDRKGAMADYSQAIKHNPQHKEAYCNRGNLRRKTGNLRGSLDDLNRAVEIDPGCHDAVRLRGVTRIAQGDLKGAMADYSRAIQLDPQDSDAFNNRGNLRGRQGQLTQAIADYTQAIKIDPTLVQAYNNRGNARIEIEDPAGALKDFNRAIKLDSRNAHSYCNRANLRRDQGDLTGAIADYSQAIKINPRDSVYYYNRAHTHVRRKELGRALADFSRAHAISPRDWQVLSGYGWALGASGRKLESIRILREAIRYAPSAARPRIQSTLKRVQQSGR